MRQKNNNFKWQGLLSISNRISWVYNSHVRHERAYLVFILDIIIASTHQKEKMKKEVNIFR